MCNFLCNFRGTNLKWAKKVILFRISELTTLDRYLNFYGFLTLPSAMSIDIVVNFVVQNYRLKMPKPYRSDRGNEGFMWRLQPLKTVCSSNET